ncbi:MAG: bifunctional alpha,alpha-trehalose-phosphate synthase (UDP-forming)/trehalose-phosphatase [Phycisphaerae bacterium]|nr:bifunctional alpha,alpha-trehalose-phosphate synthase (UDP-forming)/trehalose-phosphatase [Phycisphaerae bacterium]
MPKLVIVSNRLPVTITQLDEQNLSVQPSVGGVATGIASLDRPEKTLWFGWPGISNDKIIPKTKTTILAKLKEIDCSPVFLDAQDIRDFYYGFSNRTIWPLFHYFSHYAVFKPQFWDRYVKVNETFCKAILKNIHHDDKIWIHDYQLLLLPKMLREHLPKAQIGFFLHIPFPSFELLRLLPWRKELLDGMLGADLVGFHEYDYVRHFLSSVYRIRGLENHYNQISIGERLVRVDAFPMGIDYDKFCNSHENPAVVKEIDKMRYRISSREKVIISVDRLDYTKGILNRLEAFELFLERYPRYHGKVTLIVVAVPSRIKVSQYNQLKEQTEKLIGRINGQYSTINWTPISYLYRCLDFEQLTALYNVADVALITPLRDGMNLIAKEFVACQQSKKHQGILILSEMAGAASELAEGIIVNPYDTENIVQALLQSLKMTHEDKQRRNQAMQDRLCRYTIGRWAGDFLDMLDHVHQNQEELSTRKLSRKLRQAICSKYKHAKKRLILLDYDGTLVHFHPQPQQARPDPELMDILTGLSETPGNEVVIISGRDRKTLTKWLGKLNLHLIAEHGAFVRQKGGRWKSPNPMDDEWKKIIHPIMDLYVDRTPRSFVEEKNYSLVWHCRKSEPGLAQLRTQELKNALVMLMTNLNIGIFEGHKILEVKHLSANKGTAVSNWLNHTDWDFVLVAGDDYTDEDMFNVVDEKALTIHIGHGPSKAMYHTPDVKSFREFLNELQKAGGK